MTRLTIASKRVRRETQATFRGTPLCVELGSHTIVIREKGRRRGYEVSIDSIFTLGAKKEADRIRAEKAEAKKNKKKGKR